MSYPIDESPVGVFDLAGGAQEWIEDWYDVDLDSTAVALHAVVAFDRASLLADVTLEILDADGGVLAADSGLGGLGPIGVTTVSPPAGVYRIRLRHDGGRTNGDR